MKEIFIKNVLDVEVDGLRGINRYVVKAMYDEIQEEGYATIKYRTIEDITLTWSEIEEEGGIAEINRQLKEIYNV